MPAVLESRSIIEAAEQAAAANNYTAAEQLLREAAAVQEATLGPLHPDLANTLNNLGIVCEKNEHADEAERCFRRAVAIATAAFEPDHPFVATSRQNLRDFCIAHTRPIELPPIEVSPSPRLATRKVKTPARKSVALNALGPIIMLAMILVAILTRLGSTERTQAEATATGPSQEPVQASAMPPPASAPVAASIGIPNATPAPAPAQLTLVRAQLCATLDEWLCDPADVPVPAGPLFFFTQVKSDHDMMIQHRWYRDDRLVQSVDLPIQASLSIGYRSFSRLTMNSESAGSWRIELWTEDGKRLHEERFSVR